LGAAVRPTAAVVPGPAPTTPADVQLGITEAPCPAPKLCWLAQTLFHCTLTVSHSRESNRPVIAGSTYCIVDVQQPCTSSCCAGRFWNMTFLFSNRSTIKHLQSRTGMRQRIRPKRTAVAPVPARSARAHLQRVQTRTQGIAAGDSQTCWCYSCNHMTRQLW
jgi:hypothetical protein